MGAETHIVLISHAGSPRHATAVARLGQLNLRFTLSPAIFIGEAGDIGDVYDEHRRLQFYGYPLRKGEMGCFLAHRGAWQKVAEATSGCFLVLEDDAHVESTNLPSIHLAAEKITGRPWVAKVYSLPSRPFRRWAELEGEACLGRPTVPGTGTVAYLITPEAARRLLEKSSRFWCAVDDFMNQEWEHDVTLLHCEPSLASHRDDANSLIGDRLKPTVNFPAKIGREIRRAWLSVRRTWHDQGVLGRLGLRFKKVENLRRK